MLSLGLYQAINGEFIRLCSCSWIKLLPRMCIIHSSSFRGRGVYDTHPWLLPIQPRFPDTDQEVSVQSLSTKFNIHIDNIENQTSLARARIPSTLILHPKPDINSKYYVLTGSNYKLYKDRTKRFRSYDRKQISANFKVKIAFVYNLQSIWQEFTPRQQVVDEKCKLVGRENNGKVTNVSTAYYIHKWSHLLRILRS